MQIANINIEDYLVGDYAKVYYQKEVNRNKEFSFYIEKIIDEETQLIKDKINEYEKEIKNPCLKHCITREGMGYWALWDEENLQNRAYFGSNIELTQVGGCLSCEVVIDLLIGRQKLLYALHQIKKKLKLSDKQMEINDFYLNFITRLLVGVKIEECFLNEIYAFDVDKFQKDYPLVPTSNVFDDYNGNASEFYKADDIIMGAINKLYKTRNLLEEIGQWNERVKPLIDIMYDHRYHRGIFGRPEGSYIEKAK